MQVIVLYVHVQAIVKTAPGSGEMAGVVKDGGRQQEAENPLQLHGVAQGDPSGVAAL
jgi:hypothetical protein